MNVSISNRTYSIVEHCRRCPTSRIALRFAGARTVEIVLRLQSAGAPCPNALSFGNVGAPTCPVLNYTPRSWAMKSFHRMPIITRYRCNDALGAVLPWQRT